MDANTIIWILIAGAGIWLLLRMMKGGGCCGGGDEKENRPSHQPAGQAHRTSAPSSPAASSTNSQVYAIDPVCGMEVSATGVHRSQHEGRSRFFCSARCKASYDADPERYEAVTTGAATHGSRAN